MYPSKPIDLNWLRNDLICPVTAQSTTFLYQFPFNWKFVGDFTNLGTGLLISTTLGNGLAEAGKWNSNDERHVAQIKWLVNSQHKELSCKEV